MINIKPVAEASAASSTATDSSGGGLSDSSNTEQQVTPRLEAPPQKQNVWGATRQKLSTSSLPITATVPPLFEGGEDATDTRDYQEQLEIAEQHRYFPEPAKFSYEEMQLYREEMKDCSTPREGAGPEGSQPPTGTGQDSPPMPELLPARGHFVQGRIIRFLS